MGRFRTMQCKLVDFLPPLPTVTNTTARRLCDNGDLPQGCRCPADERAAHRRYPYSLEGLYSAPADAGGPSFPRSSLVLCSSLRGANRPALCRKSSREGFRAQEESPVVRRRSMCRNGQATKDIVCRRIFMGCCLNGFISTRLVAPRIRHSAGHSPPSR